MREKLIKSETIKDGDWPGWDEIAEGTSMHLGVDTPSFAEQGGGRRKVTGLDVHGGGEDG